MNEIKFWEEWLNADCLKRQDMVEKLPFFKMCLTMKNEKVFQHAFASMLNGYFEDLESAVYTKMENNKILQKSHNSKAKKLSA